MPRTIKEHLDKAFENFQDTEGRGWPDRYFILCPGCLAHYKSSPDHQGMYEWALERLSMHCLNVRDVHKFDGNVDLPTFEPSLMWNFTTGYVCHSFIRNGMIQFLDDCTHPLKGQTVELPEIEEETHYHG